MWLQVISHISHLSENDRPLFAKQKTRLALYSYAHNKNKDLFPDT